MEKEMLNGMLSAQIHCADNGIQREFNRKLGKESLTVQQAMVLAFLSIAEKEGEKTYTCQNNTDHKKYEPVPYVAPDKDLDEVPKTGDNSGMILATMTGIAMLSAVAYVFGKKRSVR